MRYKVGDRVKIRKDLKEGEQYGICTYVEPMQKYLGKEFVIETIEKADYTIRLVNAAFYWTEEMIEGLAEECVVEESEENMEELISVVELYSLEELPKEIKYIGNFNIELYLSEKKYLAKITKNPLDMYISLSEIHKKCIKIIKEPLLNEEEKEFLRTITHYLYTEGILIKKVGNTKQIYRVISDISNIYTGDLKSDKQFKNLEIDKEYPISELLGDE